MMAQRNFRSKETSCFDDNASLNTEFYRADWSKDVSSRLLAHLAVASGHIAFLRTGVARRAPTNSAVRDGVKQQWNVVCPRRDCPKC